VSDAGSPGSIGVFRALQLGDLLCAVPTLRALRAHWPRARITLVSLPWVAALVERFGAYIDELMTFPGFPGFPESRGSPRETVRFLSAAQQRRFDLLLQLHGSGELSNPLVELFGARRTAGFYRRGGFCPDPGTFLEWRDDEQETERGLRLLAALGVPGRGTDLELPLCEADEIELEKALDGQRLPRGAYVCVHPGAQLPSRRWLAERFATVADALAARGLRVVLTGTASERSITHAVADAMRAPATDLAGKTTLGALAALVDGARLVVANDTGVRHVAAARATPYVAVACGSDVRRWAPRGPAQRLLHAEVACRPCGHVRCPVGHACASLIESAPVIAAADELLGLATARIEERTCAG
jgi:ADP-heptose:LPS heptosyltransferase